MKDVIHRFKCKEREKKSFLKPLLHRILILLTGLVDTYFGRVQGSLVKHSSGNVYQFLSLPYAEKPIGHLRFASPVSFKSPWSGTRNATTLPSLCTQANADGQLLQNSSEDCLYLNLWVPATVNDESTRLPVMIFIHGGSFNFGTTSESLVNSSMLASQGNVIVATFNYRLGFLGFLTDETGEDTNQGIRDQATAIQWIHDNIGPFGGDANRLTIFGHSAGAISVGIHMLNPNLPISGGIMQSGHPYSFLRPDSIEVAREKSLNFSRHYNCSKDDEQTVTAEAVDCLRSIDVAQLITYGGKNRMHSTILPNPLFGDSLLPDTAARYMKSSGLNGSLKPLLIGFNQDEGELWVERSDLDKYDTFSRAEEQMKKLFKKKLTDDQIDEIAKTYLNESMNANDLKQAFYDAYGDLYVYCGSLFFVKAYEDKIKANASIYMYNLRHRSSVAQTPAVCSKVCHGEEMPLVFARPLRDPDAHKTEDMNVSKYIIAKWSQFARESNIQGWSKWTGDNLIYNEINSQPADSQLNSEKFSKCETIWRPIFNKNGS